MTSPGQIKRTPVQAEGDQNSAGRNSPFPDNDESLMEIAKRLKQYERLAERVELLEEIAKKTSATEGRICRVNSVLHLKICIKYTNITT